MIGLTFIGICIYFAIYDPDRLGPPSHQFQMAKLLQDERKRLRGMTIDGELTTNTEKPEPGVLTHG